MRGLRALLESGLRARGAVVAEPTGLEIVVAHKGVARFSVSTTGTAGHSSRPEAGVNAIYRMAKVVTALEHYAKGGVGRETHPMLGKGTLSVGVIRGGEYVNIIPDRCEIDVDRRILPGEDGKRAVSDVRTYLGSAIEGDIGLEVVGPKLLVPGLNMSADDAWVKAVGAATKHVTGRSAYVGNVATTHAGVLMEAGVPAVVLGPGSMGQAHTATEQARPQPTRTGGGDLRTPHAERSERMKSARAVLLALVALLGLATTALARDTISLNGEWQVAYAPGGDPARRARWSGRRCWCPAC